MSKSAIQAMTMSLASEWGRYGIRLNAIAPGEIPTEGMSKRLTPGSDPARRPRPRQSARAASVRLVEELQNFAAFLMSDGCNWLSGETIAMDGAQALATGGNFYQLRACGATRNGARRARRSRRRTRATRLSAGDARLAMARPLGAIGKSRDEQAAPKGEPEPRLQLKLITDVSVEASDAGPPQRS